MLCRFWHQKNSPLYISIISKCKFSPRNLSETVMKTSFSILLFYGGTRGIGQDFGEEKRALSLIFCSFQGLFTYKWQWRTKSSSTVVQGSIKRKPSSNIAGFPRDLNEDNGNWMSIVAIFVLVFTSSLYMLRAIQLYVAWSEGWNWSITRARRWLHPSYTFCQHY